MYMSNLLSSQLFQQDVQVAVLPAKMNRKLGTPISMTLFQPTAATGSPVPPAKATDRESQKSGTPAQPPSQEQAPVAQPMDR